MVIDAAALPAFLRALPLESEICVRDGNGQLVRSMARHECEILCEHGHVEGVANKRGFKYLRLTVAVRVALALLRRKLCASGRTISEACQLVRREHGATFAHITRRTNTYNPTLRREMPTYRRLREAVA